MARRDLEGGNRAGGVEQLKSGEDQNADRAHGRNRGIYVISAEAYRCHSAAVNRYGAHAMNPPPVSIVFALFPGVTQLDFTGPHQVLSRLPGAVVIVASRAGGAIAADGLVFSNLRRLEDIPRCDVICVPGGAGATDTAIADAEFLRQVRRLAEGARFVTAVCTGSLVLGAAGLLQGRRAACHWAWRDLLVPFGAIPDPARVVRDGNRITGGGVTAGIDFALTLAAELADAETAQAIQLALEYAPAPPFAAGRPETAPAAILRQVNERNAAAAARRRAAVEAAAARLGEVAAGAQATPSARKAAISSAS
jgi:cyclohexyl-isocyanide hydratase